MPCWAKHRSLSPAGAEGGGPYILPFCDIHFPCTLPTSRVDKVGMNPLTLVLIFYVWKGRPQIYPVTAEPANAPCIHNVCGSSGQQFTTYGVKKYFGPFTYVKQVVPLKVLLFKHSSDQHGHIFTIFKILWNFFSWPSQLSPLQTEETQTF